MFGKRSGSEADIRTVPVPDRVPDMAPAAARPARRRRLASVVACTSANAPRRCRSTALRHYYQVKAAIFGALIEAIDLAQLAKLDVESARGNPRHRQRDHRDQEYRDIHRRAGRTARRYLQRRSWLRSSNRCWRDDIADIMVNGAGTVFIEVGGKIQKTESDSATTSSCSTSASASSVRSAGASTESSRYATRLPTARASTPSYLRWRSTDLR